MNVGVGRPQTTYKVALLALIRLAAFGCGQELAVSEQTLAADGAVAVATLALEPGQAPRGYAALPSDPIGAIGHGVVIAPDGTIIDPTPDFVRTAQQYYLDRLLLEASEYPEVLEDYERYRFEWEPEIGAPEEFADRAKLITWLLERLQPSDYIELSTKNDFLAGAMASVDRNVVGDMPSREAYQRQCMEKEVPLPPRWDPNDSTSAWTRVDRPLVPDFLGGGKLTATVWYYQSTAPRGLCIALPRASSDGTIKLLGVICQGNDSSHACFWDNARRFRADETGETLGLDFNAGPDLKFARQGTCTNCHRGENVFIVHPGSALDVDAEVFGPERKFDLNTSLLRAKNWVKPLVDDSWPQNPETPSELGPVPDGELSCLDCHGVKGEGGGLGPLDNFGYCSVVSRALFSDDRTMPPSVLPAHLGNPGPPVTHSEVIRSLCSRF